MASTGGFMTSIRNVIDPPVDVNLVDNTARLLDLLNKTDRVAKLLNRRDARGYTLIHLAAERNRPESLKCLLIKSGNPNVRSSSLSAEVTPLHVAASLGHLACLQLLVQLGGDVLARDIKQLTPIDHANISGHELCLNYLHEVISNHQMEERRELEDVLTEVERNLAANNVTTLTPWKLFNDFFPLSVTTDTKKQLTQAESLMYRQCTLINSHELVRVLSRITKDVPLTHSHCSLFHAAARYGRHELVKLLTEKVPQIALSITAEGYHALHIAVAHRHLAIVKLLTHKQAQWVREKPHTLKDESAQCNAEVSPMGTAKFGKATMSGHTVLHFAVALGNHEALYHMLKHYKELQLKVNTNECGYTPLHLAVFLNDREATEMLLRRGGDPNIRLDPAILEKINIGRTPLTEATINKNLPIMNLLLDSGADDRHHDALKVCVPAQNSCDVLLPLLGTLVKQDDTFKPQRTGGHKDRQLKMASVEWSNLQLSELPPSWFSRSVSKSLFFRSLGIEVPHALDFVSCINLSNNTLSALPEEIFHLPRLSSLNASNNCLTSLPEIYKQNIGTNEQDPYQWPCAWLAKLNLSNNSLTDLPEFLFFLPKLMTLDLSHNNIHTVSFAVWSSPRLHNLNLSFNCLEEVPTNWPQVLNDCTVINTTPSPDSSTQCTSPSMFKQVKPPKEEKVHHSISVDSPVSTEGDDSSDHEITPISKLQDRLNIANAHLPIEWDSISSLEEEYEGLAILSLAHNNISQIPDNFPCLAPKLKRLDMSRNELTSICLPRSFPSSLTNLYLSDNYLHEINSQLTISKPLPCTNPQVLIDNNNTIHVDNLSYCPHRSHAQLLSLGVLEANNCQLTIANFYSPQVAIASSDGMRQGNKSEESVVPPTENRGSNKKPPNELSLRRLVTPLLTRLALNHNYLMDVPDSVCEITSLTSLDLSHNGIIQLPANLGNLGNLWEFPLAGLKLISPPHNIIERGKTKDIIGFLWSLLQKARPYHRMKLMLVGKAARGKTTLLSKISEKGQRGIQESWGTQRMSVYAENLSTVGIVVSDWTYYRRVRETQTSLKSITFMTWDFGGQEEYYATHQCFLSRRSLFLVVWNVTHGMLGAEELKPWLLNIQARAPHSPVLIVGTHLDKVNSRSQKLKIAQCSEFIDSKYGSVEFRKEGFPQVMGNFQVSCKGSGRGISELRDTIFDVASQVKESTVAGRGIGCGRIPEYRLLMDQLVPASYLQLEDTVRKIAFKMRVAKKPPVLTYKELREHVFTDPNTLFGKSSVDRELEQAARFLNDNGTMLHYDDPLLSDLYFVDPQWLCDMMAHIITVREINPMIRDGIMKTRDFKHIFNDIAFPIHWQRQYIRLLTTFEVVVELGGGELLIPSTLPPGKPNLPRSMFPEELKFLPPLRQVYLVPFIPSGFWPRLVSRLLTDRSLLQLAKSGCSLEDHEMDQLSWVKWRTGMILQYGNLNLLQISELDDGLFPGVTNLQGIKIYSDEKWRLHTPDVDIFGINIEVPDIYPILKYPEIKPFSRGKYVRVRPWQRPHPEHSERSNNREDFGNDDDCDSQPVVEGGAQRVIYMEQVDDEFKRLCEQRNRHPTASAATAGLEKRRQESVRKAKSVENLLTASEQSNTPTQTSKISEDAHDVMRVGLLSKVVEHISLLVEDWFVGVRPRTLVVPCPHCSADHAHEPVTLRRSFSNAQGLLPETELRDRESRHSQNPLPTKPQHPRISNPATHTEIRRRDSLPEDTNHDAPSRPLALTETRESSHHSARQRPLCQQPYYYAFRYNDCVVTARNLNTMFCPAHGDVQLQYMAPDTLFLMQGKDVIINDLTDREKIGQGAFATVFKAKYRMTGDSGNEQEIEVALKALTKEWQGDQGKSEPSQPRLPTRHSIVEGFNNLKKELCILSPLKHKHVVHLFGIMLRPLGLVLELAPQGSMKSILKNYSEAQVHISVTVLQPLIAQVASAVQYLHTSSIIYRDLKSDNILVWNFPSPMDIIPKPAPGQQLGLGVVYVKLSDYGISQFAATQGAKGLVGTPGFIAPEILKYHGREMYSSKVDIFSFGMFIYELITLHIPFENLNGQQANQALEKGSRPPLTRKDFPCPVLVRELMVWCWQQDPDRRPNGFEIIEATKSEQFPWLIDGIRACNSGQITSTCVRAVPLSSYSSKGSSRKTFNPFTSPLPSLSQTSPTSFQSITPNSRRSVNLQSVNEEEKGTAGSHDTEWTSGSSGDLSQTYLRKLSADEPRPKFNWSPRMSDQLTSPFSDDDQLTYEVWVSSNDAHHSTATVIEYSGKFTSVEDIELGDSPVLCISSIRDKVWLGFEIGCLIVFDANSKKPCIQSWIKQHVPVLSITHIPALRKVYVGLGDGTVLAFSDDINTPSNHPLNSTPVRLKMTPLAEYSDPTQISSCLLAIPKVTHSDEVSLRKLSSDQPNMYELWVGQKRGVITILDADTLTVIKFVRNTLDLSKVPTYVAYLSYAHLVCALDSSGNNKEWFVRGGEVSVYGALYHGQYVTRWDTVNKKELDSRNCQPFMESDSEDCCISALLFSHSQLYVALTVGTILIFEPHILVCLGRLSCHRGQVTSLLALNLSALQPADDLSMMSSLRPRRGSDSSTSQYLDHHTRRSPSLNSLQHGLAQVTNRLLSFGTGFRSYIEADETVGSGIQAGFLLVWDSEHWNERPEQTEL